MKHEPDPLSALPSASHSHSPDILISYDCVEQDIVVAGVQFRLLKVRDTNALVDAIDRDTFAEDERLPYWADIWTSSEELARWCLQDGELEGKRVLELGCGLGLAGIAAAKAGAFVTFSDYEVDALTFAKGNAARNLPAEVVATHVQFLELDWRTPPRLDPFDVILAADVVYERRNFLPLMDAIAKLLAPDGTAVFTEPGRSIGERFVELLREQFPVTIARQAVELNGRLSEVVRAEIVHPKHFSCSGNAGTVI